LIRPGYLADLVLLDPDRVIDHATLEDSHALSEGISRVWVNGKEVYQDGRSTGVRSGKLVTRPQKISDDQQTSKHPKTIYP
jgi:N-acyl-D-aspartate/D-glutamate deacylase